MKKLGFRGGFLISQQRFPITLQLLLNISSHIMNYSPKLKMAMEDIKIVLAKYDIAAIIALHKIEIDGMVTERGVEVEGFFEYHLHINPSYSAANIEEQRLIVKGDNKHYPTPDARDIMIASTVNMFDNLLNAAETASVQLNHMRELTETLIERINSGDDDSTFTTYQQQNN